MSEQTALSTNVAPEFKRAVTTLSAALGIEPNAMIDTLKAQCFMNTPPERISNAQLAAFISVATALDVNPLIPGFLYAYPTKSGGIQPIMGPDAVFKKLDEMISGGKLDYYDCTVYPEDVTKQATHAIARIYRKGSDKPASYTAIRSEWYVDSNPNWKYRERHMLWLRAIKQAARMVIHGLPPDNDENKLADMLNVTPEAEAPAGISETDTPTPTETKRPKTPPRSAKGAAAITPPAETPPAAKSEQGKIVDAEIVDPKVAEAEKAKSLAAKLEAKERAEVAAQETAKGTPAEKKERAMLNDGEAIEGVCEVMELLEASMANLKQNDGTKAITPFIRAKVRGAFWGEIWHFHGATIAAGSATPIPLPIWTPGKKLNLKLFGKLSVSNGKVLVRVEEASEVQAASQPVDVD
jgi:hypothetical protein